MKDPDKTFGATNVLVIRPGDECWIAKEIHAVVLQVIVRNGNNGEMGVQYQVAWWSGNDRKCEWLDECEVKPISPNGPFMRIGFACTTGSELLPTSTARLPRSEPLAPSRR